MIDRAKELNACDFSSSQASKSRIAVIGAGLGGLAAAFELSNAGYSVDVFEARNRLGGRVHSVDRFAPSRVVEFGAELIGRNHLRWMSYAERFGIELDRLCDDEEPTEIVMNGVRFSGYDAKRLEEEIEVGRDQLAKDADLASIERPWLTPDAERYDKLSLQDRIEQLEITDQAKQAIHLEFLTEMACSPKKMNFLALMCIIKAHGLKQYWTDTEAYRARYGSQVLASYLAQGVSGRIYLDCPVTKITQEESQCSISLRDGRSMIYQDVVLATPPSVWERIEFSPEFPVGFNPQMGSATKSLSVVKDSYWLPDGRTDLLTDTMLGGTWEGADSAIDPERVLVSFAGGPVADSLQALRFGRQEHELRMEFDRLLPGFSENHLRSHFIDWIGDPWTKGGYSFPSPGSFLFQSRILSEGIGRLHFAGEHASFGFTGFMEGGLDSGMKAANRIMKRDAVTAFDQ